MQHEIFLDAEDAEPGDLGEQEFAQLAQDMGFEKLVGRAVTIVIKHSECSDGIAELKEKPVSCEMLEVGIADVICVQEFSGT